MDVILQALDLILVKLDALGPAAAGPLEKDAGQKPRGSKPAREPTIAMPAPAPSGPAPFGPTATPEKPPRPTPAFERSRFDRELHLPQSVLTSKFWFNVIGVLLVLLGVIFLYKYSVDQGWIDSRMKVVSGAVLGTLLLAVGVFLHGRQRLFGQMLAGAGIATFYISGYAAFQVYGLIGYPVAGAWMGAVTLSAYLLAAHQDDQALTIVALIGGLSTPEMLSAGITSGTAMAVFVCGVLTGSTAIYFVKGWRPVLWLSAAGGWLSLLFIYIHELLFGHHIALTDNDRIGMQAGVIFAGTAFWLLPLIREKLAARNPHRWPRSTAATSGNTEDSFAKVVNLQVHALSVTTPFIALLFTRAVWQMGNQQWGLVTLAASALFGLAFLALRMDDALKPLAYTQIMVGIALFTMAIGLLLNGDARFTALGAEAAGLHLVSWKLRDRLLQWAAHGLFLFMTIWLSERLLAEAARGTAMINSAALADLLLIVLMAAVSFLMAEKSIGYLYQLTAYVLLQTLFLKELTPVANGQACVTVAWGASAVALLAAGILLHERHWRQVALVALFVVVAKLLLVDLGAVKAIWRVLLFIGFGILFLALSYFFQSLWKPAPSSAASRT